MELTITIDIVDIKTKSCFPEKLMIYLTFFIYEGKDITTATWQPGGFLQLHSCIL